MIRLVAEPFKEEEIKEKEKKVRQTLNEEKIGRTLKVRIKLQLQKRRLTRKRPTKR